MGKVVSQPIAEKVHLDEIYNLGEVDYDSVAIDIYAPDKNKRQRADFRLSIGGIINFTIPAIRKARDNFMINRSSAGSFYDYRNGNKVHQYYICQVREDGVLKDPAPLNKEVKKTKAQRLSAIACFIEFKEKEVNEQLRIIWRVLQDQYQEENEVSKKDLKQFNRR